MRPRCASCSRARRLQHARRHCNARTHTARPAIAGHTCYSTCIRRRHAKHLAPGDRLRFAGGSKRPLRAREEGVDLLLISRVASAAHLMRRHMIVSTGP